MRTVVVALAWSLIVASASAQVPAAASTQPSGYVLAGQLEGAPAECSASAIGAHASDLFAALAAGATDTGTRFFGRRPTAPFQWFSFSDRQMGLGFEAVKSPDGLNEHFAKRHAAGNRWVLRGMEFNGWVPERSGVGFLIFFEYHLPDGTGQELRHFAFGKGEFHCPSSTFVVMSLGLMEKNLWDRLFRTHVTSRQIAESSRSTGGGASPSARQHGEVPKSQSTGRPAGA